MFIVYERRHIGKEVVATNYIIDCINIYLNLYHTPNNSHEVIAVSYPGKARGLC